MVHLRAMNKANIDRAKYLQMRAFTGDAVDAVDVFAGVLRAMGGPV